MIHVRIVTDTENSTREPVDLAPIKTGAAATTLIGLIYILIALVFESDHELVRQCFIGVTVAAIGPAVLSIVHYIEVRR